MSTYICDKCGCIDNTACMGNYHAIGMMRCGQDKMFKDEYANTHYLCTECTPVEYSDNTRKRGAGKWHNLFPKKHWSEYGTKEEILTECDKHLGAFVNAREYFNNE